MGPADVVPAEVESQAIEQEVEAARQEYETALEELRRRIGIAECASSIEPAGELQAPEPPPAETEESLIAMAMASRPEIQTAKAQLVSSRAALSLAKADRIPIPSLGPSYEKDESGTSFYGIALSTPVPLLNTGKTLVVQREAEYHRDAVALEQWCQRVRTEVRSGLARWEQARQSLGAQRPMGSLDRRRCRADAEPLRRRPGRSGQAPGGPTAAPRGRVRSVGCRLAGDASLRRPLGRPGRRNPARFAAGDGSSPAGRALAPQVMLSKLFQNRNAATGKNAHPTAAVECPLRPP